MSRGTKDPKDMRRPAGGEQLDRGIGTNYHECTKCERACDARVNERIGAPLISSCCAAPVRVQQGRD